MKVKQSALYEGIEIIAKRKKNAERERGINKSQTKAFIIVRTELNFRQDVCT